MIRLGLTLIALLSVFQERISGQVPGPLDGLDTYIRSAMADWQIPGLAIAVVKDDKVVFLRGYGVRQAGSDARVDEKTLFEFGSATKTFTATAMAMLVSDGKLAWDDPVSKYLPWLEFADPFVTRHVTIRDLLSHRVADGWGGASSSFVVTSYTPLEILRALAWRPPVGTSPVGGLPSAPAPLGGSSPGFRGRYQYENANYYAAAEIIATVTGAASDAFVRSRILRPLGMTSAVTSAYDLWQERALAACFECGVGDHRVTLDDARVPTVAVRHRMGERGPETIPAFVFGGGATGLHGSIADAARWLLFQTGGGSIDGTRLLAAPVFSETHAAQVSVAPETQRDLRPGAGNLWAYGLGWLLTDYHGRRASLHAGASTAYIGLLREERVGVIVLANLPNELREALVFRVFDAFVRVPSRDWSGEMLERARRRAEQARAREATAPAAAPPAAPRLLLPTYVGTYVHPAFGDVFVTHENGGLVLRFGGGQIGDLVSLGDHRFRVTWRGPDHYRGVVTFAARGERPEQLTLQFPAATFTRK
jgi:CubicO group peptidase (beta-lactamase class C family)